MWREQSRDCNNQQRLLLSANREVGVTSQSKLKGARTAFKSVCARHRIRRHTKVSERKFVEKSSEDFGLPRPAKGPLHPPCRLVLLSKQQKNSAAGGVRCAQQESPTHPKKNKTESSESRIAVKVHRCSSLYSVRFGIQKKPVLSLTMFRVTADPQK